MGDIMNFCILGEDNRSVKLREIYKEKQVRIEEADVIVCPIPFSKDGININNEKIKIEELIKIAGKDKIIISGAIKSEIKQKFNENEIKFYDLMEYEEFSVMNAVATSEGAIKKAIEMTDYTINGSNVLILGFGRIGKILAYNLSGFGAKIYCEARKKKDIALIKSMGYNDVDLEELDNILPKIDIIFNTIPSMMLDRNRLDMLKENVCIIDLASVPGGVDFEYAASKNLNTCWYLAIPSKDSPYSAALYIKETIDNILGEEDNGRKN